MLPAQIASEPSALRRRAASSGRSLYSITISRPSTCTTLPTRSSGSRLAITWRGQLRAGQAGDSRRTPARRCRPADCRPGSRTGGGCRGARCRPVRRCWCRAANMPPCPSGLVAIRPGASSSTRPVSGIDGGHRPLAEDEQVLLRQPEALVLGEERRGFVVRGRAGHQVQRNPHAVAPGGGHDLLDVNLEERLLRDRPDGEHALGMVEAQPRSLPAGHQDHAELSGAERFDARAAGPVAALNGFACGSPAGTPAAARPGRPTRPCSACWPRPSYSRRTSAKSIASICRASDSLLGGSSLSQKASRCSWPRGGGLREVCSCRRQVHDRRSCRQVSGHAASTVGHRRSRDPRSAKAASRTIVELATASF